ncbi:hypothetical protein D9613_002413 [Agrocybe pediades]|uniref:F-box domain-containing protein n=1 Tax=Agrocybe pediades TaxID=84607 RepID=A0A8H4VUC0_9AGAR|nr:hypothetical protein D9613_002413 [Agrocybe pediades]
MSHVLLPAELKLDIASRLMSVKDLLSLGQVSIVWSHAAFDFIYREVCLTNLGQNVQATINMFRNVQGSSRPVLSLTLLTLNPLHGHGTSSSLRAALNDRIPQWFQPTDFGQLDMLRGLEISGNPQMSPHNFEAFLRGIGENPWHRCVVRGSACRCVQSP